VTRAIPRPNVKQLLAALHERHGLDRDTVAAMAFERSRQQNVSLTQTLIDLVGELDQVVGSNAPGRAVPAGGTSNDVNTTDRLPHHEGRRRRDHGASPPRAAAAAGGVKQCH
jgi:hypothetical protein